MIAALRKRAFHAWFRLSRPMTLGVRALVRDASGGVLLVRHSYVPGWHLPGGGVERAETAEHALARELAEEGGVEPLASRLIGVFSNHRSFRNDHVLLFAVDDWREVPPAEGPEILERGFFAPDALPEATVRAARARLAELSGAAPVSPYW